MVEQGTFVRGGQERHELGAGLGVTLARRRTVVRVGAVRLPDRREPCETRREPCETRRWRQLLCVRLD